MVSPNPSPKDESLPLQEAAKMRAVAIVVPACTSATATERSSTMALMLSTARSMSLSLRTRAIKMTTAPTAWYAKKDPK